MAAVATTTPADVRNEAGGADPASQFRTTESVTHGQSQNLRSWQSLHTSARRATAVSAVPSKGGAIPEPFISVLPRNSSD
jgi:hypothetical protein